MLTLGVGTAQDYLSPSAKSNDISMGIDYEILIDEVSYRLFGLLNVGRTDEVEGTSNSGQLGIGFNF